MQRTHDRDRKDAVMLGDLLSLVVLLAESLSAESLGVESLSAESFSAG